MKISTNWISDFVDLPKDLSDMEMSERITLGVCEIEGYERNGEMLSKVIVSEVTAVEQHPDADKLRLATVFLGSETATVVCGAPNCRAGIKVPYAALGTSFPDGFTLEPKKIRGILSEGMLCSERELGLSENHEGLMELPADAPVGESLATVLPNTEDDLVLDVDNKSLTHRPDCWGHYGLAREFAAIFGKPFKDRMDAAWLVSMRTKTGGGAPPVVLEVDTDSANRGFLGLSVDGVTVGESPAWMQRRLLTAGMRPINSIVDISNYAMLETGMPNHIFDRETIAGGKIVVRRAGEDQPFTTLDGQERRLLASDTLVCDGEKPSGIAGIMGGLDSSVADGTTQIMIEVANWTDVEIRRTSTRLGLRTDASQRYEKCLDSQQLEKALLRILELVLELNPQARAVGGVQSANMPDPVELTIETSPERLGRVLGEDLSAEKVRSILEALAFNVDVRADGTMAVSVPTWRSTKDIECESDIVEEIGRIIGYDNIVPVSPSHDIEALRLSPGKVLFRKIQDFLTLRGRALEVMTYPLVGRTLLDKASWPVLNEGLVLANALTSEQDRMRPSLVPSLLQAASENCKEHSRFRIFETGRSYAELGGEAFSADLHQIGILFQEEKTNPFLTLADVVEELLGYLGLPGRLLPAKPQSEHPLIPPGWSGSHPHEFVDVQIMGRSRGIILSLHPQVGRTFKIKGRTALAVLDLTEIMAKPVKDKTVFKPLFRFPGSVFDLTVVADSDVHVADIVAVVSSMKMKQISDTAVLDIFDLGEEGKAVTLRVSFRDPEKTLEASFLKEAEDAVVTVLDKAGYPLRS